MQVTDEELEAVARAIAGVCYDSLAGKHTIYTTRGEYIVGAWTEYAPEARAAILAYLATPGQVRMREDVERWNLKPMNTAQKDGRELLLQVTPRHGRWRGRFLVGHYMPGGHCIDDHPPIDAGWYFWNGCMFDRASEPVGWTELPTAIDAARSAETKP